MLVGGSVTLLDGNLSDAAWAALLAATSGAALLLARPALHTDEAKRRFGPARYRRLFLAGAVSSATAGIVAALGAATVFMSSVEGVIVTGAAGLTWQGLFAAFPLASLATALLGSAVGVVRMRAWGVLLGVATSAAALVGAAFAHREFDTIGLCLASAPGLLLGATVLRARRAALSAPAKASNAAVAASGQVTFEELEDSLPPFRARIGVIAEGHREELGEAWDLAVRQK
jgi:hypothetical protein